MITLYSISKRIFTSRLLFLVAFGYSLMSCKNDIETINALTNEVDLPDVSGFNIEIS
jgi:hypothetical protein